MLSVGYVDNILVKGYKMVIKHQQLPSFWFFSAPLPSDLLAPPIHKNHIMVPSIQQ